MRQKLALISQSSGDRSVGIVHSRTKAADQVQEFPVLRPKRIAMI
jgi:hypothetical protein